MLDQRVSSEQCEGVVFSELGEGDRGGANSARNGFAQIARVPLDSFLRVRYTSSLKLGGKRSNGRLFVSVKWSVLKFAPRLSLNPTFAKKPHSNALNSLFPSLHFSLSPLHFSSLLYSISSPVVTQPLTPTFHIRYVITISTSRFRPFCARYSSSWSFYRHWALRQWCRQV